GSARDYLIGLRIAMPGGTLASAGGRVVKNVSGYDLMKLHLGALGTLGVIVAASFKVFPLPLHDLTVEVPPQPLEEAWAAAKRALGLPLPPAALEMFSDGRLLARFMGSPDAVNRMAADLAWNPADASVWQAHSRRSPELWARITAPPHRLREILDLLPAGAQWWASPGAGVAHWSFGAEHALLAPTRSAVEALGGRLVLLAAPDGIRREVGSWGSTPSTIDLMRRVKNAFDPDGILNPGRYAY
ncbi:MAG TPA: FAD-linked oxidase C-terminal domain-containing protein, partial [Patescibacteria group bacterium]|nr:FAD-linked oxidase C-terminal domain-containing protein [Patescibacteria group bacterium]